MYEKPSLIRTFLISRAKHEPIDATRVDFVIRQVTIVRPSDTIRQAAGYRKNPAKPATTQNDVQDEHPNVPFMMPPEEVGILGRAFLQKRPPQTPPQKLLYGGLVAFGVRAEKKLIQMSMLTSAIINRWNSFEAIKGYCSHTQSLLRQGVDSMHLA